MSGNALARALAFAFVVALSSFVECSAEWEVATPLPYSETAVHGIAGAVYSSRIAEDVVANRRAIHQNPETMYEEYGTSELVARKLREMGIAEHNIRTGVAITGVIAHIGAGTLEESLSKHALNATAALKRTGSGPPSVSETARRLRGKGEYIPTVILRADMDALPIQEDVDLPFKSANDGVMHACGHDAHTAMLLGAAAVLKSKESLLESLGGSVRLMFQPAEEGGAGALRMLKEGALDGGDAAVMLHASPGHKTGTIVSKAGPIMAGSTRVFITVHGVGGHAAYPHMTTDVVVAAAAVITGIHAIVSRVVSPTDAGVISLPHLRAGDAFNVLPDSVTIGGTIRALDNETLDLLASTVKLRAEKIAGGYGCTVTVDFREDEVHTNSRGVAWSSALYLPVVNDEEMFALGMATAKDVFGANATQTLPAASMAGEDFCFLTNVVPSLMSWIGSRSEGHSTGERSGNNLHNAKFELDERILPRGASYLASMAMRVLERFVAARDGGGGGASSSEL